MKNILKTILFAIIVCSVFIRFYNIFTWKETNGITHFYQLENNSADVIFYGSSHCYCTINNALLWDQHGMASYNMGESGQNLGSTYAYMLESLKTQSPKVMCVELSYVSWFDEGFANGNLYRNTIGLKWSENYLENLDYALGRSQQNNNRNLKQDILLKWPVIHSRYDEITVKDFRDNSFEYGRYEGAWTSESYDFPQKAYSCKKIGGLREDDRIYLDKMVRLAEKNDIGLVFFIAPFMIYEENQEVFNAAAQYAKSNEIPFFNFNTDEYRFLGIDYSKDMRAEGHAGSHLNNYGAEKITTYLGNYLKENFDIPDHFHEAGYDYYKNISAYYQASCDSNRLESIENINKYLKELNENEYTVFISISGNGQNDDKIQELLNEIFGINSSDGKNWVLENEKVLFCDENQRNRHYCKEGDFERFAIIADPEGNGSLLYNENVENKVQNGLNIMVYNNKTGSYVESVGFDLDKELICIR